MSVGSAICMRCGCEHAFFQSPGSRLLGPDSASRASVAATSHRWQHPACVPRPSCCRALLAGQLRSGVDGECWQATVDQARGEGCCTTRYFWRAVHRENRR